MYKIKFIVGQSKRLTGSIAGIPCILDDSTSKPKAGETWLVEITKTNISRTVLYVRPVRPWKGTPEDRQAVVHVHVDFHTGTVKLHNGFMFRIELTQFVNPWGDYKVLSDNMNAVIIKDDKAIRWNKRGKPPQVLTLDRFATKYKRQPLLGDPDAVHRFLANLEDLRSCAIESARSKKKGDAPHPC